MHHIEMGDLDPHLVAVELLAALADRRQVGPLTGIRPEFDLVQAYRVTAAVRALRQARGEHPVGRKIGFTNAGIWDEYDVHAPIWGYMYDTTVRDLDALGGVFDLAGLLEPRIEPEIALGLARAPEPDMDETALLDCVEWIAHGFEIVQSLFPGWKFAAADTAAAFGLHGAYLMGPRHGAGSDTARWLAALPAFRITLQRSGETIDRGTGANVLGGPLSALRHLVEVLADDPVNPALSAGEIVTTGTLTRAFPVAPGQTWRTMVEGLPLDGMEVRFL